MKARDNDARKALNVAIGYLSKRDHTRHELYQKLKHKGFAKRAVVGALDRCEELNYLNDEKTAGIFFRQLCRRGYGPRRIRVAMHQKGLDPHLIDKQLENLCSLEWELEAAERILKKREASLSREKDGRKRRQKAYRYLSSRGFSGEVITQLTNRIGLNCDK